MVHEEKSLIEADTWSARSCQPHFAVAPRSGKTPRRRRPTPYAVVERERWGATTTAEDRPVTFLFSATILVGS
ncbi:MAG: hypothetical protein ACRC1K_19865, partial [Planctomycetia bacterium]